MPSPIRKADVLVENFQPGTLEKWGLGWDTLKEENGKLIMVRISGFGQTLNHIKHKRVTLTAGTYIVMLEMEFDAALEWENVRARLSLQINSDPENYVIVKKVDKINYQAFYTDCLASLALKKAKK